MVSLDLIKFASKMKLGHIWGPNKIEIMSSSKDYDGRMIDEPTDDTTYLITLWKGNKLVKIKAPTSGHALAFEKCCSEREFNNF